MYLCLNKTERHSLKTETLVMKNLSQLINHLNKLQAKYGDVKVNLRVKDCYSIYGEQLENNLSESFNGDYVNIFFYLEKQKDPFTNQIINPKITFRK